MDYRDSMDSTTKEGALTAIVDVIRPRLMAEFGSWEGRSAITFLTAARQTETDLELICVDTWLGSVEHWENAYPNSEWSYERLRVVDGEPNIIETFKRELADRDLLGSVHIVRAPTVSASGYIKRFFPMLDLVYIDADHSFRAVKQDISIGFSLVSKLGIIAGDDWGWPSVRLAVARSTKPGCRVISSPEGSTYVLARRDQREVLSKFLTMGWKTENPFAIFITSSLKWSLRTARNKLKVAIDFVYLAFLALRGNAKST